MPDMNQIPEFDDQRGHRYFSANCFNRTWELIDKPDRSPADDEQMLLRAYASFWHWTQRADVTPRNLSVGYWLLSRVHALLGQGDASRRFGELSLRHAASEPPFYVGYAHEALARAAQVENQAQEFHLQLSQAEACLLAVDDPDDRSLLENDLSSLQPR